MVGKLEQDGVVIILSILLLIMGLFYSLGTNFLLKFYFIQKYPQIKKEVLDM